VFAYVQDAFIPQDRESGRSRGFAFVTMTDSGAAQEAISKLHDTDFNVSEVSVQTSLLTTGNVVVAERLALSPVGAINKPGPWRTPTILCIGSI
jgi:hypothetical protein